MEEKERIEETKKEKKGNSVLVIILCVIIALLIGYIAYDKLIDTNHPEDNTKQQEEVSEKEETQNTDKIEDIDSVIEKLEVLVGQHADQLPLKTTNLTNQDVLFLASMRIKRNEDGTFYGKDISAYVESLFGKDYHYQLEDINCHVNDGVLYQYNAEKDEYSFTGKHGHDGPGAAILQIFYLDQEATKDTITLNTQILYTGYCGGTCGPQTRAYKSYPFDDSNKVTDISEEEILDNGRDYSPVYNRIKDQLPITKFVFKKQSDGSYGLSEITIE